MRESTAFLSRFREILFRSCRLNEVFYATLAQRVRNVARMTANPFIKKRLINVAERYQLKADDLLFEADRLYVVTDDMGALPCNDN